MHRAITSVSCSRSLPSSNSRKRESSRIAPYLTASAIPSEKYTAGRVSRVEGSQMTRDGCQNAPTRFFPCGISTPVLPPTDESIMERKVVGIWIKSTLRSQVAAAKPARPCPTFANGSSVWD